MGHFDKIQVGQPAPVYAELEEWMSMLYAWQKDRKEVVRIRVIENPLTSYFNYEFDWGYIPSALHAQKVFSSRKKGLNKFVRIKYFPTFGFLMMKLCLNRFTINADLF